MVSEPEIIVGAENEYVLAVDLGVWGGGALENADTPEKLLFI